MHWTCAKKRLARFMAVQQDGNDEGILLLIRMPNANEAENLRHIGLCQTQNVAPDHGSWLHRKAI
jgi:hypothetical protein